MATKYIGADVHVTTTELAVDQGGKVIARYRMPTTVPSLREVLAQVSGSRVLVMEEGPMAGWLYRNLRQHVEKMIVCDPRDDLLASYYEGVTLRDRLDDIQAPIGVTLRSSQVTVADLGLDKIMNDDHF